MPILPSQEAVEAYQMQQKRIDHLAAENERLEARVAALEGALKQFAAFAETDQVKGKHKGGTLLVSTVKAEDGAHTRVAIDSEDFLHAQAVLKAAPATWISSRL